MPDWNAAPESSKDSGLSNVAATLPRAALAAGAASFVAWQRAWAGNQLLSLCGIAGSSLLTGSVAWLLLAGSTLVLALATSWLVQDCSTLGAQAWRSLRASRRSACAVLSTRSTLLKRPGASPGCACRQQEAKCRSHSLRACTGRHASAARAAHPARCASARPPALHH